MGKLKKTPGLAPEEWEMQRILGLPIEKWPDAEDCEIASFERMNAEAFARGERLFTRQVAGIQAYEKMGGGLFPIGVGGGKSGLALMTAQSAIKAGLKRIIILVPPQLAHSMMVRHVKEWRARVPLSMTFHQLAGKSKVVREKITANGIPGVYLFPYSYLSVPDTMEMLEGISPELVIADEAHYLRNPDSARTKRLMHFLKGAQFVGMSGTMTSKKISDYHHLATAALGNGSPLPLKVSVAQRWGAVLDVMQKGYPDAYTRKVLNPLVDWAKENTDKELGSGVEACRRAYQHRLTTTPGVVITSDRPEASLQFVNHPAENPGPELEKLLVQVENYETPEGEPIDHSIHTHKWFRELAIGFYNSQVWPTVEELVHNRKIDEVEAKTLLFLSKEHLKIQSEYRSNLREFFEESPPGLDTPREVGRMISLGKTKGIPDELVALWHEVKEADFTGRLERKKVPVRVDDFKIRAAVEWAKEHKRGILWVFHQEIGAWMVEALTEAGLDPVYAPAGENEEIEAIGDPSQGGKGDKIVVASVSSHGTGRNLQAFCDQLFVEWPRSADLCEQAIGRTHREGQKEDLVTIHTLFTLEWDHQNRAAALNDALYVQQSTSTPQRILYGDYPELPQVYPPSFLKERGFAPKLVDGEALERAFNKGLDSP